MIQIRKEIGIKTQQGFSQHTLWLTEEDARVYCDLLERNGIWHVNITTGTVFSPNRPTSANNMKQTKVLKDKS